MNYSEIFLRQWQTLLANFKMSLKKRRDAGLEPDKLDEWYQLYIKKWSSSIEMEGVILNQQENNDLSNEILEQLKEFHFNKININFSVQPKIKGVLICLVGILFSVFEIKLLKLSLTIRIIIAVVILMSALINALKKIKIGKENDYEIVRKEYLDQLVKEGEEIYLLCKKYERGENQ